MSIFRVKLGSLILKTKLGFARDKQNPLALPDFILSGLNHFMLVSQGDLTAAREAYTLPSLWIWKAAEAEPPNERQEHRLPSHQCSKTYRGLGHFT